MTMISSVAVYLPAWLDESERRIFAPDEDVATAAVAAGSLLNPDRDIVSRVEIVTENPEILEGFPSSVIREALGLSDEVPVSVHLGGARDSLDVLLAADPGSLVITVDPEPPAGSGAVLIGTRGSSLVETGRIDRSLPAQTRFVGQESPREYDDRRLFRERGWRPAIEALVDEAGSTIVAGLAERDVSRLDQGLHTSDLEANGASATVYAMATLLRRKSAGRIVSLTGGSATAADLALASDPPEVRVREIVGIPASERPKSPAFPGEIPFSLPAHERTWRAKSGFLGGRCRCGSLAYPPRRVCLDCGHEGSYTLEPLPRTGNVYTVVTVHTPVPGVPGPYDLAIVSIDDTDVRILARVADSVAGRTPIGTDGQFVLRRIAVREGVPDYGYAFFPENSTSSDNP